MCEKRSVNPSVEKCEDEREMGRTTKFWSEIVDTKTTHIPNWRYCHQVIETRFHWLVMIFEYFFYISFIFCVKLFHLVQRFWFSDCFQVLYILNVRENMKEIFQTFSFFPLTKSLGIIQVRNFILDSSNKILIEISTILFYFQELFNH